MIRKSIFKTTSIILICALLFASCGTSQTSPETDSPQEEHGANRILIGDSQSSDISDSTPTAEYSEFDLNTQAGSEAVYITLNDETAQFESENVTLNDGVLTISAAGDYEFSGSYNGQICVNAGLDDNVHLILNGVTLSAAMSPLNFVNAKNVSITLADDSVNSVTDSADYTFTEVEDEPNAAIFSKCDLTINGTGSLTVYGQYECGIRSKDDLKIVNGSITAYSAGDAIKGKDSLVIRDGNIKVQTNGDGLKSNNDEDENRGYVIIEGGTFDISAADDGIHAETLLQIYGGNITVNKSYEALEGKAIEIYGGNLDLKASDDGLNAASGSSTETDDFPQFEMKDKQFGFGDIFGGEQNGEVPEMPDGIPMTEGGTMHDMPDGMPMPENGTVPEFPNNGAMPEIPGDRSMPDGMGEKNMGGERQDGNRGGAGKGGMFGGGMGRETPEEGVYILIAGGTIRVQAGVDVIDSNGTFEQTGGTLITVGTSMTVCGQPNGVVDTNGDAYMNGGTFISLAQNSGSVDSFTNVPGFTLSTSGSDAGEKLAIIDAAGNTVFEFTPETSSSVIFLTSDLLTIGEEYTIQYGDINRTFTASENVAAIK